MSWLGDAEDVVEAARATPIENLGPAIMAVGPQQNLRVRPVSGSRATGASERA